MRSTGHSLCSIPESLAPIRRGSRGEHLVKSRRRQHTSTWWLAIRSRRAGRNKAGQADDRGVKTGGRPGYMTVVGEGRPPTP